MRKTSIRIIFSLAIILVTLSASVPGVSAAQPGAATMPPLVTSELQTGGVMTDGNEDGRREFIELYNTSGLPLDVAGWRVEYLSASHDGNGAPTRIITALTGTIYTNSYFLLSYSSMLGTDLVFGTDSTAASGLLAKSGGYVRIVDEEGTVIDLVGWGTAAGLGGWWKAPEIPAGQSIQRLLPGNPLFTTGLTFAAPSATTSPYGGNQPLPPDEPKVSCPGIVLSELLPNPAGADGGQEYIEIYNPTAEKVSLHGCTLRLAGGTAFELPDEVLVPSTYKAFYDTETDLTLPNAAAQLVWLVGYNHEESVAYPDGLGDNQAWALISGTWQVTARPTPNEANLLSPGGVHDDDTTEGGLAAETPAPCPAGKERNLETNRCRNVVPQAATVPCKPGQERNPATNRCRVIASTTSALTPCKTGQERNPETNRCRSVQGASTPSKPCAAGQQRNPETNRCRKVVPTAASLTKVEDVATPSAASNVRWWIMSLVAAGALGYAAYEWRRDIANAIHKLKTRLSRKPPPPA